MKVFAFCVALFSCFCVNAAPINFIAHKKLDNGISVTFVDTYSPGSLLLMMCVSAGAADEVKQRGVANLLCDVMLRNMKQQIENDKLQYSIESNAYTGYDNTVYYAYCKPENLKAVVDGFSHAVCDFSCDEKTLAESKKHIQQQLKEEVKIIKLGAQQSALSSLYWHSGYGAPITGKSDEIEVITANDLSNFCKEKYKNNNIDFVIVGTVDQTQAENLIKAGFSKNSGKAKIYRLQEPKHHGSMVQIETASSQTDIITIDFYWRITPYSGDASKALANEIFIKHLEDVIQQQLVKQQKIVSAASINYVNWNRECGHCCISVSVPVKTDLDFVKTAVIACVKCAASNGITDSGNVSSIKKKIIADADVYKMDAIDAADWISKRVSAGYDWEFLKTYSKIGDKCSVELVNKEAKRVFCKNPDVVSLIKPKE